MCGRPRWCGGRSSCWCRRLRTYRQRNPLAPGSPLAQAEFRRQRRRGTELSGIAVHLAHRVCEAAHPGEVLVTRTVPDLVAGSGIDFNDRGEHDLKGIPSGWRLFAVVA